jgi:hypothetical protein
VHPATRLEGAAKALRPLSPPSGPGQGKANHCHRLGPRVGGLSLGYWPGHGTGNCLKEKQKSKAKALFKEKDQKNSQAPPGRDHGKEKPRVS